MALIKCTECGKEISDKAKACPNCGCPNEIKNEIHYEKFAGYICDNCGEGFDISDTDVRDEYLCPKCNSPLWYLGSDIVDPSTGKVIERYFDESRNVGYRKLETHPNSSVTCPYCQSTDCNKITATAKVVNIALFGIFGNKRRHQFHCNNCGSDF